jgi:hypothetical protein
MGISVYDPNSENPYGIELSNLLSLSYEGGVTLWSGRRRSAPQNINFNIHKILAAARQDEGVGRHVVGRLIGPTRVIARSWGELLLVVWVRDCWDASLLLLRSVMGRRCVVVYHNPRQVRPRRGLSGTLEQMLLRRSLVVVHSEWLASLARRDVENVLVVEHPPYSCTTRSPERTEVDTLLPGNARPMIAWIGGLRADKGSQDLGGIAASSGGGWTLCYLGSDPIPDSLQEELSRADVDIFVPGAESHLTDERLVSWLRCCVVALAPYRAVTESGSVRLSLAAGVGVLGYDSKGLEGVLNVDSLFTTASELGCGLRKFIGRPWPTFSRSIEQTCIDAEVSWQRILDIVRP